MESFNSILSSNRLSGQTPDMKRLKELAYGPSRLQFPRHIRRLMQKRYDRAERTARKQLAARRMPFSGVFYPGEAVNAAVTPLGVFTHMPFSPIAYLLLMQAAIQRSR